MKLNWGQAIALFLIFFISFLGFAVYKASQNRVFLTEENYYRTDEEFNKQIQAERRSKKLKDKVKVSILNSEISVSFPKDFVSISGNVVLYKPNNARLDKKFPIKLSNENMMDIDASNFAKGVWTVKVNWSEGGVDYFDSKEIKL